MSRRPTSGAALGLALTTALGVALLGCQPQEPSQADLSGAVTAHKLNPVDAPPSTAEPTASDAASAASDRLMGWKVERSVAVSDVALAAEIRAALTDPLTHGGTDAERRFEPTLGLVFADGDRRVTVLVSLSCRRAYVYGTDSAHPERAAIRTVLSPVGLDRLREINARLFQP